MLALAIGAALMVAIAANFGFMAERCPSSGGAFAFTRDVLGHDHAFLCSWSLMLAYLSILWANATAVILIARYLLGPVFQFGFHYQVAGYDVYLGEALVTIGVIVFSAAITARSKEMMKTIDTVMAVVLVGGSVACFAVVAARVGFSREVFEPLFSPVDVAPVMQVFDIVALAPWAYLGFEAVSHAAGECAFPQRRLFPIMVAGVGSAALVYVLMVAMSVLGTPERFGSWASYVAHLGELEGLEGLPTFHAMDAALGHTGVVLLACVILCALGTTMLGFYRSASRLLYSMAQEDIMPLWFGQLNSDGVPEHAVVALAAVSCLVPFVGRAAIGWIVDVTSVSAAIVYGYTSICSLRVARREGNGPVKATSVVGIGASAVFLLFPLLPMLWDAGSLARESYLILAAWSALGLVYFRVVFQRDEHRRFGKSTVMWMFMLFLILFSSTMWVREVSQGATSDLIVAFRDHHFQGLEAHGSPLTPPEIASDEVLFDQLGGHALDQVLQSSLAQMLIVVLSLVLMFDIYNQVNRRERTAHLQRREAEDASRAKTVFLSNMSHDIRTPMNAIIGYTHLARREGTTPEQAQEYLTKIDASSKHLLALINDVLEMSRIEVGKMELDPAECDLVATMGEVRDMFATQMAEKKVAYTVECEGVGHPWVLCDKNRLNRVLLNLLSNAYKFTPEGGSVSVLLRELGVSGKAVAGAIGASGEASVRDGDEEIAAEPQTLARFELRVADTGIGMTPEFAAHVFEAFERERSSTVEGIQGTGLGMSITKSIVELMGGTIEVDSTYGEGTTFIVRVSFPLVGDGAPPELAAGEGEQEEFDFSGRRVLLAEDNEINREIAQIILEEMGFEVDTAVNGQLALEAIEQAPPGTYDLVLMDVQMPVMGGYEATRRIRALSDPQRASVPIVAASANAFAEDVAAAREAGMDAHVAKPLDVPQLMRTLAHVLSRRSS